MRGRKPKPTAVKRLAGNPGKRKLNKREPITKVSPDAFDLPPSELAHDPTALKEWSRLAPMLKQARQITDSDRSALIAVCLEWSTYLQAIDEVRKSTMLILTQNGYPIMNPYLTIASKALAGCYKLWPELGLTPSSRSRIQVLPDEQESDPWAEFDRPRPTLVSNRS
mgnify:CR=1 FL=1|tara:strand:- start:238 stop:738 length:501 start_codon:yes stop_codon:yes gene_type:complete